jgi:predicted RNase H-like HicB family nuclease
MSQAIYQVLAFWDREAEVWVAESEDILGLVTEAETIEALTDKLHQIIPELLEFHGIDRIDDRAAISFELIGRRQELIRDV